MNPEKNIEKLFESWQKLNDKVQESFGKFDFDVIKEIRKEQRVIEDGIYSILLENAPEDLKSILPEDCGDLEVGFEAEGKKFYFLMEDPEQGDPEGLMRILAITIDIGKKVDSIKDFKTEEE